jgi:hypothetical protein
VEKDNHPFVQFRFLSPLLILGLLLVLNGRSELDVHAKSSHHAASDKATHHEHPYSNEIPPSGNHTDQHGCYHSHSPFAVVSASFIHRVWASVLIARLFSPPILISSVKILQPPRV